MIGAGNNFPQSAEVAGVWRTGPLTSRLFLEGLNGIFVARSSVAMCERTTS